MASSKISVIVPVYKTEQYLDKCMQSILRGTFKEIEVILIDDGSPDGSVCNKYAEEDNRVRIVHHKSNKGLSAVRNEGVYQAKSPYLSFIDSDDWVKSTIFDDMYQIAVTHDADIVSCGVTEFIDGKSRNEHNATNEIVMDGKEALRLSLLSDPAASHTAWGKLYKRELFEDVTYPEGRIHEDAATTYLLYHKSKNVIHTRKQLYCYAINNGGIANSGFKPVSTDKLIAADEIIEFTRIICPEYHDHALCFRVVSALRLAADLTSNVRKDYPKEYDVVKKILLSPESITNRFISNRHRVLLLLFKFCKPAFYYIWKGRLGTVRKWSIR